MLTTTTCRHKQTCLRAVDEQGAIVVGRCCSSGCAPTLELLLDFESLVQHEDGRSSTAEEEGSRKGEENRDEPGQLGSLGHCSLLDHVTESQLAASGAVDKVPLTTREPDEAGHRGARDEGGQGGRRGGRAPNLKNA